MISDWVSAEFGFLASPDGKQRARVEFHGGKNHEGWYTCEDMKNQSRAAIAILKEHYPEYDHVFIFNNATTHMK